MTATMCAPDETLVVMARGTVFDTLFATEPATGVAFGSPAV